MTTTESPFSYTDAAGTLLIIQHDSAGYDSKQTDTLGHLSTFSYDANGNPLTDSTTVTGPGGPRTSVTTRAYDANGRVIAVTNPDGNTNRTIYDAAGQVAATIDPLGRRTDYVYDDRGQLISTIFPDTTPDDPNDNLRIQSGYDAAGRLIFQIDEAYRRTEHHFDALGREYETVFPDNTPGEPSDNPRTRMEYDATGRVSVQIDELDAGLNLFTMPPEIQLKPSYPITLHSPLPIIRGSNTLITTRAATPR